jgi:hypothetical protein
MNLRRPANEKMMCENKIRVIEVSTGWHFPLISIAREDNYPVTYYLDKVDNGFNGRRFMRGIKMVAALYRRQSDANS